MVLTGRWWRIGFDLGGALLPLEPVDLVTQMLVLCLGRPQVGHDVFQHVEEPPDEFARSFICDAVQVKLFKHIAAGSRRGRLRISSAIMPAVPGCGNPPHMGFQARIIEEIPFGGMVELLNSHHYIDKEPFYDSSYVHQGAVDNNIYAPCDAAFGLARPWRSPH